MKSVLHQKLEKMCRRQIKPPHHWDLIGAINIRLPETRDVITTKRAIYAAYIGPIPAGKDLRTTCGDKKCVSPYHQELTESRRGDVRALSLPGLPEMLHKIGVNHSPVATFLKGLSHDKFNMIKAMFKAGSSVTSIAAYTQLPLLEIMRIRSGFYDAVYSEERRMMAKNKTKVVSKLKHGDMVFSNDNFDDSLYKIDNPPETLVERVEPKDDWSVLLHGDNLDTQGQSFEKPVNIGIPGIEVEVGFVACEDPYVRFSSEGWVSMDFDESFELYDWVRKHGYAGNIAGYTPPAEETLDYTERYYNGVRLRPDEHEEEIKALPTERYNQWFNRRVKFEE